MEKTKDIYIVHVGGYVGSYLPSKCPHISYAPSDKFVDFVQGLLEDFPKYRLRCVINKGIEQAVWKHINYDKLRIYQLKNGGRNGK